MQSNFEHICISFAHNVLVHMYFPIVLFLILQKSQRSRDRFKINIRQNWAHIKHDTN